jgi:hypothetical protein
VIPLPCCSHYITDDAYTTTAASNSPSQMRQQSSMGLKISRVLVQPSLALIGTVHRSLPVSSIEFLQVCQVPVGWVLIIPIRHPPLWLSVNQSTKVSSDCPFGLYEAFKMKRAPEIEPYDCESRITSSLETSANEQPSTIYRKAFRCTPEPFPERGSAG